MERFRLKNKFRLVDAHCHVWPGSVHEFKTLKTTLIDDRLPIDYSIEVHFKRLELLSIDAAVLVPHIAYYGRQIGYALQCAKKYPGKCAVMGAITENEIKLPHLLVDDLSNGVRSFRIRGIDLIRPMDLLCEFLESSSCVLCPLLTRHQSQHGGLIRVAELAKKYANLVFVLDHFGGDCSADSLSKFIDLPIVLIKISDFGSFDSPPYDHATGVTVELTKTFGSHRLMWGSNNPVFELDPLQNLIKAFQSVKDTDQISEHDKSNIFGETADQIFFCKKES